MTSIMMEKALRNEAFFKESNELIVESALVTGTETVDVICECAARGCMNRIPITAHAYAAAHTEANRFVVTPGHELPELEDVIERHADYLVIQKRLDPDTAEEIIENA